MAQNFKISVDDKELEKAFDSLEKKASSLEHTMAELGKNVDDVFAVDDISKYTSSLQEASDMINLLTEAREKQYQEYHNLKFDKDTFGIVTDEEVNKSLHNLNLLDSAIKELEQAVSIMSDSKVDFDKVGVSGLDKQAESLKRYARMIDELVDSQDKAEMKLASFMENITEDTSIKDITKAQEQYIASLESISYRLEAITVKGQDDLSANQVKEIQNITKRINEELAYSKSRIAEIGKETDNTTTKAKTYYTQIREIREEMASLVSSDGTIPKENIQRYDELKDKLSELGTAYRRVQQEQKLVTQAGSSMVAGITQGLQAIAGTFTLVQGISAMFTDDAEKIQEIQKKLQTAMAITMGIQQVSTALHATSALRIGLVSRATDLLTTSQTRLATALGISTAAARALMGALTLGLSVAIGAAIVAYNKYADAQERAAKAAKELSDEYSNQYKSIAPIVANFTKLQMLWGDTNGEINKQNKFLKDNRDELDKLGIGINNVNDANDVFVNNSSSFLTALELRAKASANMALAETAWANAITLRQQADDRAQAPTILDKIQRKFKEMSVSLDLWLNTGKYTEDDLLGIVAKNMEEDVNNMEQQAKEQEKLFKEYIKTMLDLQRQAEASLSGFSILNKDKDKGKEKEDKAAKEYLKLINDQQKIADNEREELEKQGIDGRIKLLQYEAERRISLINKEKEEILKLNKDADISIFNEREKIANQYYGLLIQKENDAIEEANTKKLESYKSYEEKRADLVEEYNKKTKLAEGLGLSPDTINRIQTELKQKLSELNFAELMDTSDLGYLFEDLNTKATSSIQLIIEELTRLRDANSSAWSVEELKIFNDQITKGEALMSNRKPLTSITSGIDEYKVATANIKKFKQEIDSLDAKDIANSEKILKIAKEIAKEEDARTKALDKVNKGANQMGSNISAAAGGMGEVMGMLEGFGVEFDESIGGALSGIGQMGDALANLDVKNPASIISSGMGMIAGLGNTVSSLFGDKGRMISQKTWDEFDSLISAIDVTISKQKELFATMSGAMAESAVDRAIELEKTRQASIRDMGMEYMYERKSNKHSRGYQLRKELEGMRKDLEASGFDLDQWGGKVEWIFQMSAKDIAKFRDENLKAWSKLDEQTRTWLLELEKSDEAIKELENSLKDLKTGTTFESFLDAAMEQIRDFKGDIKDLSKFTEEQLRNAMLNGFKQQFMREAMQPYYDELAKIFSDDIKDLDEDSFGNWSDRLAEALKKNNDLLNEKFDKVGLDLLEETEKAPKASQGYQVQMSQETGDEISGMVRGMQMTLLNQESEMIKQTDIFSNFGMQFGSMQQELQAISNATLQGVYYLQDIEKHTRVLPTFSDKLDKIEQNTR